LGGFADIITDWIFFHAMFFVAIGFLTGHIVIGFLCVVGYMSREFTRTKFTQINKEKITDTQEAKNISGIVSTVRLYDLASWFWIIPFVLLIEPVWIIYFTVFIEYGLLFGELVFNYKILRGKDGRLG